MSRPPRLGVPRGAALLALGALAVHQLRYLAAFGSESGEALHREGHGYLAEALPILVALAAAVLIASLVASALAGSARRGMPSVSARALRYGFALLVVYAAQELAEGALAAGHPAGISALIAEGGWVAIPLAAALGLVVALAERLHQRGAERIAGYVARPLRPAEASDPAAPVWRAAATPLAASPLAFGLARRPPPPSA